MDNKGLPLVVSEMLIEMQQINTRITRPEGAVERLEDAMHEVRDEVRASTNRLIDVLTKNTAVMIERLKSHNDRLHNHDGCLSTLENPPR